MTAVAASTARVPLARLAAPWYALLLVLETLLLTLRWSVGDSPFSILILSGFSIGLIAIGVGARGGVEVTSVGHCGGCAFISCVMDLSSAISLIVREFASSSVAKQELVPADLVGCAHPALLLLNSAVQLGVSFAAVRLCKDITDDEDALPLCSTSTLDEAAFYQAPLSAMMLSEKPFKGKAFKLSG
eukprot:TRINITY_DN56785_c0_g1_i1.p1 TRINITY_DN56785_c0_g1~~TRINITY_DN56785_c0_g1_i1.p1  ORF type:complete len:187 (-),score=24.03 TRINITY_DN56785_c0_g1_i1:76-636(-)